MAQHAVKQCATSSRRVGEVRRSYGFLVIAASSDRTQNLMGHHATILLTERIVCCLLRNMWT
jgi:hypothetical protein